MKKQHENDVDDSGHKNKKNKKNYTPTFNFKG